MLISRLERRIRRIRRARARAQSPLLFQVVGERCSGTNFVDALIVKNVVVGRAPEGTGYGWKHGFPTAIGYPDNLIIVVVFREVFGWVESMFRKPWHTAPSMRSLGLSEFIRAEWCGVIDNDLWSGYRSGPGLLNADFQWDRHPISGRRFKNIIALRTAKLEAMLSLQERGARVIYTTLAAVDADPQAFLLRLANDFDLPLGEFQRPQNHFGHRCLDRSEKLRNERRFLTEDDREFIRSEYDRELELRAGFNYPRSNVDEVLAADLAV